MEIPRLHLFEFEDLKWLPKIFRQYITDLLTFQINRFGIYEASISKLAEVLDKTGQNSIVDLCSGSGGPSLGMRRKLSHQIGREIEMILTDKFPNLGAFASIREKHVRPITESVDALKVSKNFKGLRTLFTAFHHFKPKQAQKILQSAVEDGMPIAIFEITERKIASLLTLIIAPIACLLFTLMMRPLKIGRLFWTYLIPIVPILYTWDGLISNLRSYTKKEWLAMANSFGEYAWETGDLVSRFHIKVFYLIGYTKQTKKEKEQKREELCQI